MSREQREKTDSERLAVLETKVAYLLWASSAIGGTIITALVSALASLILRKSP